MGEFARKYRELTKKKPYLESGLIVGGVCLFAFLTSFTCKAYFGGDVKNTELVLNEEDRNYYLGDYEKAIADVKEAEKEEVFPVSIMKESTIYSVKGDLIMSNSLAEKAYIQNRVALDKYGVTKYKDEVVKLSNDISFTYFINGEVSKGIEFGEFLLAEFNDNYKLKKSLVAAYVSSGQEEKAIELLDGIEKNSKDSYMMSEMAEMYIITRSYEKAIEYLKEAYAIDNNNINIMEILKEYSEDKNLKKVLEENEKDEMDNMFLAQLDIMQDRTYNKGIERINKIEDKSLLKKYLELQASEKDLDENRSSALIDEIMNEYEGTFGGSYILSNNYIKNGDIKNATHYANETIRLNEEFGKAYGVLFTKIVKMDKTKIGDIGPYIREGLERNPYSVEIMKIGAAYYNELQLTEVAYNYYDYISKLERYDYKNHIAKAMIESTGTDKEIPAKTIEKALKLDPENSDLHNYLGVMYLEAEDNENGIKNIRKAYELDDKNIKALNNAAVYYTKYERNISRAYSNIKSANELMEGKVDPIVKETILVNLSLIKNVHDEVVESDNQDWKLENLELLK